MLTGSQDIHHRGSNAGILADSELFSITFSTDDAPWVREKSAVLDSNISEIIMIVYRAVLYSFSLTALFHYGVRTARLVG